MNAHSLSLEYVLAPISRAESPSFLIEPAGDHLKFSARNLRSVDRLDVRWSTALDMTTDGKNPAAVALGRLGRAANTKAQKEAARKNGTRGGRPKGAKDSKPRTRRAKVA